MPGKKGNRNWVMLHCQEPRMRRVKGAEKGEFVMMEKKCNEMNYVTEKNKRNNPEKIELSKFCRKCKRQTLHIEGKSK